MSKLINYKKPFLSAALLSVNIQSFVLLASVKGVLLTNTFLALQILVDLARRPKFALSVIVKVVLCAVAFISLQMFVQLYNGFFSPQLSSSVLYISADQDGFFKSSTVTQSLYLLTCISLFFYLLEHLRANADLSRVLSVVQAGLVAYMLYGFYEFIYFIAFSESGDFLSNRIAGDDFRYGLFQTFSFLGMSFMRLKSLSGEPSMLAFTLLPFFVYYFYTGNKIWGLVLLALVLSASTTFVLGLLAFLFFQLLMIRRSFKLICAISFILILIFIFFPEVYMYFYDQIAGKVGRGNESGLQRSEYFSSHFSAWLNSSLFNFIFGHGFGYVRSTDYLSTALFNTGLIGFGFITYLFFWPIPFLVKAKTKHCLGLAASAVVIYVMMMASVSEFFYFHIWLFLALMWFEVLNPGASKLQLMFNS